MVRLKRNSFYNEKVVTACVKFSDEKNFFLWRSVMIFLPVARVPGINGVLRAKTNSFSSSNPFEVRGLKKQNNYPRLEDARGWNGG